jgi:predicted transcriptional regulator
MKLDRYHLHALRTHHNIMLTKVSQDLQIPINDLSMYELGTKPIPKNILEDLKKYYI